MNSTQSFDFQAKFNPTRVAIMKTGISHVLSGCFSVGLLAVALQAGRPPQGGETKPAAAAPATPATKTQPAAAPQPTIINLSPTGANLLQLGVQIKGPASYPFVFAADPALTNGLQISAMGEISGTLTKTDDQATTITVKDSAGKTLASYPVILHAGTAPIIMLGASANPSPNPTPPPDQPAKTPIVANSVYAGGDTVSGSIQVPTASKGATQATCTSTTGTVVTLKRGADDPVVALTDDNCSFSYQFNTPFKAGDSLVASTGSGATPATFTVKSQVPPNIFGEELRAIIGYQQAGSSSSSFTQNWFTDFYISRPVTLSFERVQDGMDSNGKKIYHVTDNHLRWWGNVRIASFPQDGNQTVAATATGLPAQVGALKLNQLAQGAEFLSGLEWVFHRTPTVRGFSENSLQRFSFGVIAAFGATGFFTSPSNNVQVYQVPGASSPQLPAFQQAYGNVTTPYVAFIQPDTQRFPKEYLTGLRLTTRYIDPSGMPLTTAPAMLAISLGQNQIITADRWTGVVGRFEAFYPLPFANRGPGKVGAFSSLYLFGTAQMRLGGHYKPTPSLVLGPAPTMTPPINAFDSDVTLVTTPNARDEYRIGFGVDLVGLISQLTGGSAKNATGNAAPSKAGNTAAAPTPQATPQPQTPAPNADQPPAN
jgi:hypothetical protein